MQIGATRPADTKELSVRRVGATKEVNATTVADTTTSEGER